MTELTVNQLARCIYKITVEFNLDCQKRIPEMKIFDWKPWHLLDGGIKNEYQAWTEYLLLTGKFNYTVEERHAFAVANRLAHGWRLGDTRNNELKTDPYLIPMSCCPDWMYEWCEGKDLIMVELTKEFRELSEKKGNKTYVQKN